MSLHSAAAPGAPFAGGALSVAPGTPGSPAVSAPRPVPLADLRRDKRFKKFLAHDFDASAFVSEMIQKDAGATERFLEQLETQSARIDNRIAMHVTDHHGSLTSRISHLSTLRSSMKSLRTQCDALKESTSKTKSSVLSPYKEAVARVEKIERMQDATDALRRTLRCVNALEALKKSLESFDSAESEGKAPPARNVARAAAALKEAEENIKPKVLMGVTAVDTKRAFLRQAGRRIRGEATDTLQKTVQALNQSDLGNALQAFYNLGTLSQEVNNVLLFIANSIGDVATSVLEVPAKPPPASAPAVRAQLWQQLEDFWERLHVTSLQAWNLERVLAKKRDPVNHVVFLTVVKKESRAKDGSAGKKKYEGPFHSFWMKATAIVGKRFAAAAKGNALVKRVLTQEYPRLRLALNDVLERMFRTTDSRARQVGNEGIGREAWQKDALFGAFSPFLKVYLARSHSRLMSHVPDGIATVNNARSLIQAINRENRAVARDEGLKKVVELGINKSTKEIVGRALRHAAVNSGAGSPAAILEALENLEIEFSAAIDGSEELVMLQDMIDLLQNTGKLLKSSSSLGMTSLPTSVILHVLIGMCPAELEYPYKRLNLTVVEYVSEWMKGSEFDARKHVIKSLDLYRQRVSATGGNKADAGSPQTGSKESKALAAFDVLQNMVGGSR